MPSLYNHALYQVATKALLYNNDKILTLTTPDGYLDFPGGRVNESERDIPWTEALKREVSEEIGEGISFNIGQTLFVSKRQYDKGGSTHYIAAIFYECRYQTGDIKLSDEHAAYEWLSLEELCADRRAFLSDDERTQISRLLMDGGVH